MKILLAEDDVKAATLLTSGLSAVGISVVHVCDGDSGLNAVRDGDFDVLVIDWMMPGCDGFTMVERLRLEGYLVPVIFLTARGSIDDRVAGLRAGGDDYLVKPYALAELIARLEVLASRGATIDSRLLVGDLSLDCVARCCFRGGVEVFLNPREFSVLEYFMRHEGQLVTRSMLLEHVWDYHFDPETNVIDVYISRLRQKIDRIGVVGEDCVSLLRTVRGRGYILES